MELLHEDAAIVVVAKPSGVLVHRTDLAPDRQVVLQSARDAIGGDHLFPVHRLDRGTSGVLVLARTSQAARLLHEQFEDGRADKRYLALVRGHPPTGGTIDHPVPRCEGGGRVPAVTDFRRIAVVELALDGREPGLLGTQCYALIEARPRGGRFHQVRRHLKHAGHPVIGDVNYGRSEHNRLCDRRFGLRRLALHAASLGFEHPDTKARVWFQAALPADLREPLQRMSFPLAAVSAGRGD